MGTDSSKLIIALLSFLTAAAVMVTALVNCKSDKETPSIPPQNITIYYNQGDNNKILITTDHEKIEGAK